jgi:hypothetical protein
MTPGGFDAHSPPIHSLLAHSTFGGFLLENS